MATLGSVGVVNFGRKDSDKRYNTIENYNTSVTGEPYMSFKIHDGVNDSDDDSQVTPLKLFGDKLIQGTHMQLVSDIYTDSGEATPNLLIKAESNGHDVNLVLQGARNGATTVEEANITFENLDSNVGTGTQTNQVGIMGRIGGKITNAATNVGDMLFFSSLDGVALTECARVTRTNTLKLTGELERPENAYMSNVSTLTCTTQQIGKTQDPQYILFNTAFTTQGLQHNSNSKIFHHYETGQSHYRVNVKLQSEAMQGSARHFFLCYIYTYTGGSAVSSGTLDKTYFLGNGYARALTNTNLVALGGNIDLYLNEDDNFEVVIEKIYHDDTNRNVILEPASSSLIIERIH